MLHGQRYLRQPDDVARKTAPYRHHNSHESSKADLMEEARRRGLPGRSRMDRETLRRALGH
jgi:hypothetical protein